MRMWKSDFFFTSNDEFNMVEQNQVFFQDSLDSLMGFSGSSAGKKSACNAGDPSSIPGSGRSPGEGNGYLLQYSWASVVLSQ